MATATTTTTTTIALLAAPMKPEQDVAICMRCAACRCDSMPTPIRTCCSWRLVERCRCIVARASRGFTRSVACGRPRPRSWSMDACSTWMRQCCAARGSSARIACDRVRRSAALTAAASAAIHLPCAVLSRCGLDPTDRTLRCLAHRRDRRRAEGACSTTPSLARHAAARAARRAEPAHGGHGHTRLSQR
jgi:hypothetical protein